MFYFVMKYVNEGKKLEDTNIFTLITIFNFITFPLGILPWAFSNMVQTGVSYKRISRYLNEKEINKGMFLELQYPIENDE